MSDIEKLSFEQAFGELEDLVQQMETGDLTLDQAMALFERGVALATLCNAKLDSAELRVRQLVPVSGDGLDDGAYDLSPFEESPPSDDPQ